MNILKDRVQKFYEIIWNAHDKRAMPSLLHGDVVFRGSLGQEACGHEGLADYVDKIHKALGNYQCVIEELVMEDDKVFAKMTFAGVHQDDFLGYRPTGKRVSWAGCALFRFNGDKISDIWVLGDLKGLEERLKRNAA